MKLRVGCELHYDFPVETPMIALLSVHYTRFSALERPDHLITNPPVQIQSYRDSFGNWCSRMLAPAGRFTLGTDGIVIEDGLPDPYAPDAQQHAVQDLPAETLLYLQGSRYCETDVLSADAWALFGNGPTGWGRVQAVCDFVHRHLAFNYALARPTRTAAEAYRERLGVCRDFAHLAAAFCRALNIPTRYCTGYISDIGTPQPWSAGDFAAWIEVYLSGQWWVFDPRNNTRRVGRVLIAQGRDAADVPLTQTFGPNQLTGFRVWADEVA